MFVIRSISPVILLLIVAMLASCGDLATTKKYHISKDKIMVESFFKGKLTGKQYFTADTIPNGPFLRYSLNGLLEHWTWYENGKKRFQADYKNNKPVELTGNPFLYMEKQHRQNHYEVEMVCPPYSSIVLRLYRQNRNREITDYLELPVVATDSTCYTVLDMTDCFGDSSQNKYGLAYFFADSVKQTIRSADIVMQVKPEEYIFIEVKSKQTMPLYDSIDVHAD